MSKLDIIRKQNDKHVKELQTTIKILRAYNLIDSANYLESVLIDFKRTLDKIRSNTL